MSDYPQTQNTGNQQKFIKEIPGRGTPEKVNQIYLEGIGYKSKNDRTIPGVLKFVGILQDNGAPTEFYATLRHREEGPKQLAAQIRKSYKDLFSTYPDANTRSADTLKDWFASRTKVGEASIKNIVQTFLALCSVANFADAPQEDAPNIEDPIKAGPAGTPKKGARNTSMQVAFNIQIQVPGEQTPEVYEAIFRNLGKYVLGIENGD